MCFSPEASFTAGAVLAATGVVSVRASSKKAHLPFAIIPFLFSAQQFSEGALWLGLLDPEKSGLVMHFTYVFLFFAQVVWPFWVPFSMLLFEKKGTVRTILGIFTGFGIMTSVYLAYALFTFSNEASIRGHHIYYEQQYLDELVWYIAGFYVIPILVSPFVSSHKRMNWLGVVMLITFLASLFFYRQWLVSVWCFFAAVISVLVIWVLKGQKKGVWSLLE